MAVKAFRTVMDHITERILDGGLQVGDRLPGERELAEQCGVSRAATREAIRALEAQGVLTSGVGTGPNSGTRVADQRTEALTQLLRLQVVLNLFPPSEVIELRVALERVSVQNAAERATDAQLARARELIEAMEADDITIAEFNRWDLDFHVALAQASGMEVIRDLSVAVRGSVADSIERAERRMQDWPTFRSALVRHHREIYDAVARRDGKAAADVVESHIRAAYAQLLPDSEPT